MGLRGRMAASYMAVTAAAVLVVEAAMLGVLLPRALSGSDAVAAVRQVADGDAKAISAELETVLQTDGTVQVGDALTLAGKMSADETALGGTTDRRKARVRIPASEDPHETALEGVVDFKGRVVLTSARNALPGGAAPPVALPPSFSGGGTISLPVRDERDKTGGTARVIWAVSPVLSKRGRSIVGAVYVQVPKSAVAGGDPSTPLEGPALAGLAILALILPVGVVFGLLSTRRLIRRVHRLASVTTAVADGDFEPRVRVEGGDEVGRLEDSVNRMAERLGTAVENERRQAGAGARQAERARIARELHDSISQDLFSMSLLAGGLRRALDGGSRLGSEAEALERTAGRAMREMQALLLELRPVALEDSGLLPAVDELCRAYETRLGVRVKTRLEDPGLDAPAEHAVLRVVQEALGNAVKHGDPELIQVELSREDGRVLVEVRDDGRGFEPAHAAERHGMGLGLMRERMSELGGTLWVTGRPGAGTTVRAEFPGRPA